MKPLRTIALASAMLVSLAANAAAHCDSMDGPVVKAAQSALATGNVAHVLIWVKSQYEQETRDAFAKTVAVRKFGREATEMADRWFFETVVRLHRQGEGEPFTGLKPIGYYDDPAYIAADRALDTRSFESLSEIPQHVTDKLRALHKAAVEAKDFAPGDIEQGRKYVQRYTAYLHYVEELARITHAHEHAM